MLISISATIEYAVVRTVVMAHALKNMVFEHTLYLSHPLRGYFPIFDANRS